MAVQGHPGVLHAPNLGVSLTPLFLSPPHIHPLCVPKEQTGCLDVRICSDLNPSPSPAATTLLGTAAHAHLTAAEAASLGFLRPPSPSLHSPHNSPRDPGKTVRSSPSCSAPAHGSSPSGKKAKLHRGLEASTPALLRDLLSCNSLTSHLH